MGAAPDGGNWHRVCPETALTGGRFHEFTLEGQPCFVFRHGNRLLAYRNLCPHLGITFNWRPGQFMDADGCFIHCANHGALFTPESGECIAGPCQGDRLIPVSLRVRDRDIEARL
ncbi:MAG: Rieske (2Fe-2S) protein [Marinobacter sp.]